MNPELDELRDIHLPEAISWWPPAPGWWLLPALIGLACWAAHRCRRGRAGTWWAARRELRRLRLRYRGNADSLALSRALSVWLRRTAISLHGRKGVAGLSGQRWLELLDRRLSGRPFQDGAGRALATIPYRRDAGTTDGEALLRLCERWLAGQWRAERGGGA